MADAQKKREEILGGKRIESNYVGLFLVSIFISFSIIQNSLPNQLHLENYFWMLELIILLILSHLIMKTKIGNHHKLAVFVTLPILIFEIIGFCLPFSQHDCENMTSKEECKEEYITDNNFFKFLKIKCGRLSYLFAILFTIVIILRDYSWIKSKYLMDIRGIHPWRIMMFTGVIGLIFVFILFVFATLFPCNTINNVTIDLNDTQIEYFVNGEKYDLSREICLINKYDNETKQLQFYYDNFISFINEYNGNNSSRIINESTIKIELVLVIPIYFIMNLIINISNIMIIRYLEPNIILINSNVVYFIEEILLYFSIIQGDDAYKTFIQFIFTELKQIFSLIGNIIYIELIEFRFCKFDYDLRKNIKSRGERESSLGPLYEGEEENEKDKNKYDLGLNDSLTED
jgi:hypothetical protein